MQGAEGGGVNIQHPGRRAATRRTVRLHHVSSLILMAIAGFSQPVGAQAPPLPKPPDALVQTPIDRLPPPGARTAPLQLPTVEEDGAIPDFDGQEVTVSRIILEDTTALPDADLRALSAGLEGRRVPVADLFRLRTAIEVAYRRQGFFLTRVLLPEQSLDEHAAEVRLKVLEGHISDVIVQGDVGPVEALIRRMAEKLRTGKPARLADVERQLLLIQDIPGISARARFGASPDKPAGSVLTIDVVRTPYAGFVAIDNRGPGFSGPWQAAFGLSGNSATAYGDRIEGYIFSTPGPEQRYGQMVLSGILTDDGLSAKAYVGYGPSFPGGLLGQAGFASDVLTAGAQATYPLVRSRRTNLWLSGGLELNNSHIKLKQADGQYERVTRSHLRIGKLSAKASHVDGWRGATELTLGLDHGLKALKATPRDSDQTARPESRPDFTRVTGRLSRRQALGSDGLWTFDMEAALAGQYGFTVLPPSQKAQLGGLEFGRGYYFGQLTGDRAVSGSVEFQARNALDSWISGANAGPYLFYDHGIVWNIATGDPGRRYLHSIGGGLRFDLGRWLSTELEYARRLTRNPSRTNEAPLGPSRVSVRLVARY